MRINEFTKTYGKDLALNFEGTDIEKGRIYAIIGSNGSGKSTFAKVLSGVLKSDKNRGILSENASVGYMPQKSFGFRLSVKDNIALGCNEIEKVESVMDSLSLKHLSHKKGNTLSGGETARVALARLLVKKFDILILDEPTAAMDMETTLVAEEKIKEYSLENDATVFLITHSLRQAKRMADYIMYFKNGVLVESGKATDVLDNPVKKETMEFLEFIGK